ncbi:MAG TPA: cyclic nucleotide-binding domain-containing protein [Bryobacteraceae bacterium]|nr:cyclic nucleotide-binding domain-containing protein [Bryobacteraceae bacterium]
MSDVHLTIDGMSVTVPAGTTIFDAARMNGIPIPTLCHQQNETPVGVCRVCVVDAGGRVLSAACVRPAEDEMVVTTNSEKVLRARRTLIELLMADHPSPCARQRQSNDCELETLARQEGIQHPRFPRRLSPRGQDNSSLVIVVDHEACILCDRCIRGCDEIRQNNVLGRRGKGFWAGIAFDLNSPMGNSSCVSCGECMVSCPTGALTNKSVVKTVLPGEPVDVDELQQLTYFQKISGTFLELNKNAVVRRHFRKGEIVCREGEYGSTAFYILEGQAQVFLSTPMAHVQAQGGATGFFSRLTSRLAGRQNERRQEEQMRESIPIDASVDLPYDNPVATLGPGDLFGEMTCMNLYPRSATVRAATDCVMLEMLRNVLDIIQRNKTLKAQLDANYRKRALDDHLRSVPMFASLTQDFIDVLRNKVELVRYTKGDVICRQGDIADSFYLVRLGFVKVSEPHPGGELVLAYLGRGSYFGEIGLLGEGRRTATCTALDHVELVRIHAEEFQQMVEQFPDVGQSLERLARERQEQNRQRLATATSTPLDQFLTQGLMEAQSLLVLDLERCTRCDACVRACADAHDGITRLVREGQRFDKYLVATSCRHCRDPLCMVGCPVGSIRRRNSLEVIIENWCIGCGLCAKNCPYGNINLHPFNVLEDDAANPGRQIAVVKHKATSCDLCTEHAEPSCVYACPHDAAHRVEPNEFFRWVGAPLETEARVR